MRLFVSTVCILTVLCLPIHQRDRSLYRSTAQAEPLSLALVGIAVGLAGIATDVYGMSQESDLSTQVADKVSQVTTNQIKLGLSPLQKINPKLKQMMASQKRAAARQKKLFAGQKKLLAGQQKLLAGQEKLRTQMRSLTQLVQDNDRRTQSLIKKLSAENKKQHHKTQALIVGLQNAKYGAALRLIDLAGKAAAQQPDQARQWLNQALSSLLETQAYFNQQEKAGSYISREYRALVHLSLATCYLGLKLPKEGITEIDRLVSIPSVGAGLNELIDVGQSMVNTGNLAGTFADIKAWSYALADERMRLAKLKQLAVKIIQHNPALAQLWSQRDNAAFGRAQISERELALQAFAIAVSRHQGEVQANLTTHGKAPQQNTQSAQTQQREADLDLHREEELNTLKRAAHALKDTKALTKLIQGIAHSAGTPKKEVIKGARQTFQRVSAEVDPNGALNASLTQCAERGHFERAKDCHGGLAFLSDVRQVLKSIDLALDKLEQYAR